MGCGNDRRVMDELIGRGMARPNNDGKEGTTEIGKSREKFRGTVDHLYGRTLLGLHGRR